MTSATKNNHDFFFKTACVDFVLENGNLIRRTHNEKNDKIDGLRKIGNAGLIAFSSGTTAKQKAILHDMSLFLNKFSKPKKSLNTINFLLFDHVGGLNTLFYSLFSKGTSIIPKNRTVECVLAACKKYKVELLPTTPTFLRMLLLSGHVPEQIPSTLKIVTYGTEKMDDMTLKELCVLLPDTDFRQTYGISELGVLSIKSEARNSLFFKIGGEGVQTRIDNGILQIKTKTPMVGYLNAPSPFSADGWYNTKDFVIEKNGFVQVVGRDCDVINVSGLKFMASEVEKIIMQHEEIMFAKVVSRNNPITGQHCEVKIQPVKRQGFNLPGFRDFMNKKLEPHMIPKKISIENSMIGSRLKIK